MWMNNYINCAAEPDIEYNHKNSNKWEMPNRSFRQLKKLYTYTEEEKPDLTAERFKMMKMRENAKTMWLHCFRMDYKYLFIYFKITPFLLVRFDTQDETLIKCYYSGKKIVTHEIPVLYLLKIEFRYFRISIISSCVHCFRLGIQENV
jgi:hypothetical protein